jgi:hypothetical protein
MPQDDSVHVEGALPAVGPGRVCARCGVALDGVDARELCPACSESASLARVASDKPCIGCGYNLNGLPVEGVCPECATGIRLSLRGSLLRYGSPSHIGVLHAGAFLVELAVVLAVIGVAMLIALAAIRAGGVMRPMTSAGAVSLAAGMYFLGAWLVGLLGWWLVAAPDPGLPRGEPGGRSRRVLRAGVAVQAAGAVLWLVLGPAGIAVAASGTTGVVLVGVVWLITVASVVVSLLAAMAYLIRLAARIPDTELASRARSVRSMGGVVIGGWIGLAVASAAANQVGGSLAFLAPVVRIFSCMALPVLGVTALVGFITFVVLVDQLREDLKRERVAAELERAAASGSGARAAR